MMITAEQSTSIRDKTGNRAIVKTLTLSALFPPFAHGGAENSAANLATWLASQGIEASVLAASVQDHDEAVQTWQRVRVYRRSFPRPYPVFEFPVAPKWKKPIWHFQDWFDPRNRQIVSNFLDEASPDLVLVHYMPGIGYNALREISRRKIPTVYYLHDLGLACSRMSMFRNGKDCEGQCLNCRLTSDHRMSLISEFDRIGFCSPSQANLDRLKTLLPLADYPSVVIPNANFYPNPEVERTESPVLRVLYVGRLHPQKGVDIVLRAVQKLARDHSIQMRVVGGGQIEQELRATFGHEPWCTFTGHVSAQDVSNEMANADVLVVPSVWLENAPGVAIQALSQGLPVIGSDVGGIPELVDNAHNGELLPPGDLAAWTNALRDLLANPEKLVRWRANAAHRAGDYEQSAVGRRHLQFMEKILNMPSRLHG